MSSESHEPWWYKEEQLQIHKLQRDCWGFHPPEVKDPKHQLCDACIVKIFQRVAATERDRAASFVESLGHPELAARIRGLP